MINKVFCSSPYYNGHWGVPKAIPSGAGAHLVEDLGAAAVDAAAVDAGKDLDVHLKQCQLGPPAPNDKFIVCNDIGQLGWRALGYK